MAFRIVMAACAAAGVALALQSVRPSLAALRSRLLFRCHPQRANIQKVGSQ